MSPDDSAQQVDASGSDGVQQGSGNIQNNTYFYGGASTPAPPIYIPVPPPPRRRSPQRLAAALVGGAAVVVLIIAATTTSDQHGSNSQSLFPAAESSVSATPQQSPTASPSPSPADPMAGAITGDCFMNDGTEQDPDLQPDLSCVAGDFDVAQVLPDTTGTSGCDGTAPEWGVADSTDDQVLCLSYQNASSAYNAAANDCVFGPPGSGQIWSTQPCGVGNFTVLDRYTGATADEAVCGPGSQWWVPFTVNGYPGLDAVLCLKMNYPLVDTAPMDTCLYEAGLSSYQDFTEVPCGSANVYITGRVEADNSSWCGSDGWFWWPPPGYPSLGFTTCLRQGN